MIQSRSSRCFFITGLILLNGCHCLSNVSISVPAVVIGGDDSLAVLRCDYTLDGEELYAIRWYVVEYEFYRYVPRLEPPHLVFPLTHASVDVALSDAHSVALRGLTRSSSLPYKCEVSADAPYFTTAVRNAQMLIVEPPRRAPLLRLLTTAAPHFTALCSADAAFPAPNLTWILDGREIVITVGDEPHADFKLQDTKSRIKITFVERNEDNQDNKTILHRNISTSVNNKHAKEDLAAVNEVEVTLPAPLGGSAVLVCRANSLSVWERDSDPVTLQTAGPRPASVWGPQTASDDGASSLGCLRWRLLAVTVSATAVLFA